jgi:type I restriction enzyme S subunit
MKALGEVCDIEKAQGVHADLPYIGLEDIEAQTGRFLGTREPRAMKSSTFRFSPQHVLYGRLRPYLSKVFAPDFDGHCSTEIFPLKCRAEVLRQYLVYWFLSDETAARINATCTGARMPRADMSEVMTFELPIPSFAEQQRIVGVLDEAFVGIATAKANAEQNLRNARALFTSHLTALFDQPAPEWLQTTIGNQVTLQRGFDITKDQQVDGVVPVVSSGGIKSYHNVAMVRGPGVVIGRKGTLGKAFFVESDFWPHDTTLWVRDFKANVPKFVYYFFTGLDVAKLDSGTANPALNRNQVHPIRINWPPTQSQGTLVAVLDELEEHTNRLALTYARKVAELDSLTKSLLQSAFSGQL